MKKGSFYEFKMNYVKNINVSKTSVFTSHLYYEWIFTENDHFLIFLSNKFG